MTISEFLAKIAAAYKAYVARENDKLRAAATAKAAAMAEQQMRHYYTTVAEIVMQAANNVANATRAHLGRFLISRKSAVPFRFYLAAAAPLVKRFSGGAFDCIARVHSCNPRLPCNDYCKMRSPRYALCMVSLRCAFFSNSRLTMSLTSG